MGGQAAATLQALTCRKAGPQSQMLLQHQHLLQQQKAWMQWPERLRVQETSQQRSREALPAAQHKRRATSGPMMLAQAARRQHRQSSERRHLTSQTMSIESSVVTVQHCHCSLPPRSDTDRLHCFGQCHLPREQLCAMRQSRQHDIMMCLQAEAGQHRGQAQRDRTRAAHDVSALRGEALRQGDIIADLRVCLRSTEVF